MALLSIHLSSCEAALPPARADAVGTVPVWLHSFARKPLDHVQEVSEETGTPAAQLRLNRDNLERVLMARLMEVEDDVLWPWHYLLACYSRATDEFRSAVFLNDRAAVDRVQCTMIYAKELIVSYSGLLLTMDMFPQVSSNSTSFTSLHSV